MHPEITFQGTVFRVYDRNLAASEGGLFLDLKSFTATVGAPRSDGYLGIGHQKLAHRVIAKCWLPAPEGFRHIHHINGIKHDNRSVNLEWVTPKTHMAERHVGVSGKYTRTEETREKLRKFRTGRVTSEETKKKQRDANLRLGIRPPPSIPGYRHSDEARIKMRENSPKARGCIIRGVEYPSFLAASRATGIKQGTIRKRCLSSSFGDYILLES